MDIRNIQKTGGQSYNVTLPKEWITRNYLKDKDRVKIYNNNDYLTITPFFYKRFTKAPVCHIDGMSANAIEREVIGFYLSGAEEIIVKANPITYEQRAAVRQISYRLIGCECMESTTNNITLKNVSNNVHHLVVDYIKKMILIILIMYQDTVHYLQESDYALARDVIERDTEIDRLQLAIMRSSYIRMQQVDDDEMVNFSPIDAQLYQHIAVRLERIADHIVRIGNYFLIIKEAIKYTPLERKAIQQVANNLQSCRDIISSFDKKKAHTYLDLFKELSKVKLTKYQNKNYLNLAIADSVSRINHYIANIAEEIIHYVNIKASMSQP